MFGFFCILILGEGGESFGTEPTSQGAPEKELGSWSWGLPASGLEQMFAFYRSCDTPGNVARSYALLKKKKILPLLLYHISVPIVKSFLENFFKKFFIFYLTFTGVSWYNYYRKGIKEKVEGVSPPKPPNLILYHKELCFVKFF